MYRSASFLKLVSLAFLFTFISSVGAQSQLSAAQLTLNWADNSSNESGFHIERKTGASGTFAQVAQVSANTTSYLDNSLANGTTYCYRVNAFNSAGNSAYTNVPCATTPSAPPPSYLLSITKAGTAGGHVAAAGIDCGSDCSESYSSGTQVTLTAYPASGATFAGWSGAGCGSTVTVNSNMICTATFNLIPPTSYLLTVVKTGTGSGTVTGTGINCGSDCSENLVQGTQVALTATAASGSTFAGWSGSGCGSTVTVNGNMTCTATFNIAPATSYLLTVKKAGTAGGHVAAAGIDCGSDCSESYPSGTQVTLTVYPASGATFAGWSGAGCGSTVTVNGNMTCTATFNIAPATSYLLTVSKAGTGSGTVTATGINCGSDCSESYPSGTKVTLTATPASGSSFYLWEGSGCGSTVTVNGNMTCYAVFKLNDTPGPAPTYLLTISKAGAGSGTVTGTGIDCGSDCSESFTAVKTVTLSAKPAIGSVFAGWTGSECGSKVTVNGNLACTATFNLKTLALKVTKSGKGHGTVTRTGVDCGMSCGENSTESSNQTLAATAAGIDCGSNCVENVYFGNSVTLDATPSSGSLFAGWKGRGCGSSVVVTGNMTCTAIFNPIPYTLTVTKAGTGSGKVTAKGINCGDDCSGVYLNGSTVSLSARPDRGSHFVGWTGQGCDSKMTMAGDMTCTAIFDLNIYEVAIVKLGTGSGTVTAAGIDCGSDCSEGIAHGSTVMLKATPAIGSRFAGWKGKSCGAGSFVVTRSVSCSATFVDVLALMDRIGVYRPTTGQWFLDRNATQTWEEGDTYVQGFSAVGTMPLVGEWNYVGVSQLGLFQPSTLQWHLDLNDNKAVDGCESDGCEGPFGEPGDVAVVGRWELNGKDRIGTFRPSNGFWYLDKNGNGEFEGCTKDRCAVLSVYVEGDLPVVGDWSGNGIAQLGLFRPSTGEWFLDRSGNFAWDGCGKDLCLSSFGTVGDIPLAGDWDGTGKSKIGVFRPNGNAWFLDHNGNGQWDGCEVDVCVAFGIPGDLPVVGKW